MRAFGSSADIQSALCAGVAHPCKRVRQSLTPLNSDWLGIPPWFLELSHRVGLHNPDLSLRLFQSLPTGLPDAAIHGSALKVTASFMVFSGRRGSMAPLCCASLLDGAGTNLINGISINWSVFRSHLLRSFPEDAHRATRFRARHLFQENPRAPLFLDLANKPQDSSELQAEWVERFSDRMRHLGKPPARRHHRTGYFSKWRAFRFGLRFQGGLRIERYGESTDDQLPATWMVR